MSTITIMRVQEFFCALLIPLFIFSNQMFVSGQCVQNQKDLLFELRENLAYDPSSSSKLAQWNESIDCCQWRGVSCDSAGRVTGLDLSSEFISGQIDSLFRFESLQNLNLAQNNFDSVLPAEFGTFANLSYLNLSGSGFSGQIPLQFSRLARLVVLDLSSGYSSLYLENPNLRTLIQNFSGLRELHLDGVNISASGYDWCNSVSSSLPNLRVLSLPNTYLTGPFDSSLTKLKSLEIIRLDGNPFSAPLPEFFADFPNLRVLTISSSDLSGFVPEALFQIPSLRTIDLSNTRILEGSLPEFPVNSSLQNILLSYTKFSGSVPVTIGRLKMLSQFDLRACNFSGIIPNSFTNLSQLVYLDLSSNNFTGPVPSFNSLRKLATINLGDNGLSGQIHDSLFEGLEKLDFIRLTQNSLEGDVPSSLFVLSSLKVLSLSNNKFSGFIRDLGNNSSLSLEELELDSNNLQGKIPRFLFNLYNLSRLSLAWNNFNGSVDLTKFQKLKELASLDLSHNNLSVHINENVSMASLFPRLSNLNLASCNVQKIPNLRNQSSLMMLDLSGNNVHGEIPNWLWEVGDGFLRFLNLSHNQFTTLQEPYRFHGLHFLDLHSNMLGGQVPLPPPSAAFVDFSSNNFSSSLPPNIGNFLTPVFFFSLANNKIIGTIPTSLCNASRIQVLDLSNNSLSGRIPSCLVAETLRVLNLRRNILSGNIPNMFPLNCGLETLDLSWNHLEGKVPVSLSRCSELEVLNLGHNNLSDTFPCFKNLSQLSVLALRFNQFYGNIGCLADNNPKPNLQILDLASNNFDGVVPANLFLNMKAMTETSTQKLDHLSFASFVTNQIYYQDSVAVTLRRQNIELQKILTIFTSIDFSKNHFRGVIPQTIGELDSLYVLNFSHNALSSQIPASFGNLKTLESLDMSFNNLSGHIPRELASLTFLSFLNLSYNHLTGRIPQGSQFQTFPESSFIGNEGLCGFPLTRNCSGIRAEPESRKEQKTSNNEIYVSVALGFLVGLIVIFAPLLFCKRWRKWFNKHLNKVVLLVLHQERQLENKDW